MLQLASGARSRPGRGLPAQKPAANDGRGGKPGCLRNCAAEHRLDAWPKWRSTAHLSAGMLSGSKAGGAAPEAPLDGSDSPARWKGLPGAARRRKPPDLRRGSLHRPQPASGLGRHTRQARRGDSRAARRHSGVRVEWPASQPACRFSTMGPHQVGNQTTLPQAVTTGQASCCLV